MTGLVIGALLSWVFDSPLWAAVGFGILSAFVVQALAESSLTVVRMEYAKMARDFREEAREALEDNPEPKGFFARLKYLDFG